MAELKGDKDKVKQAVMLLMDKHWGLGRVKTVRARIRALPHWSRPFVGSTIPINYLVSIVKDDPSNAIPVLNLLDMVERKHADFWKKVAEENQSHEIALNSRIRNIHDRRIRIRQALFIEACKAGRKLTKEEQEKVYAKYTALWNKWREEYEAKHTDTPYKKRRYDASMELNARMQKLYENAKASPETYGIRTASQIASHEARAAALDSKIEKLRKKWNGK